LKSRAKREIHIATSLTRQAGASFWQYGSLATARDCRNKARSRCDDGDVGYVGDLKRPPNSFNGPTTCLSNPNSPAPAMFRAIVAPDARSHRQAAPGGLAQCDGGWPGR